MNPVRSLFPALLCFALPIHAQTPEAVAGNDEVKKIMETRAGRGVMADDTPPTPPLDAVKKFTMRSDVAVDLMAAEPAVEQPLYASWDSKGRMWVTMYRQYQFPAGLKIISYDQHLRAKFDKVPLPPPRGEKGADKITVFEDTDGDGTFDKHTDVITGLNIASAALPGMGRIWVLNPPYLLSYPDADLDGLPDGDPEVELSGFGLEDTHSVATNLQWGMDGWLYGANGSTTTGKVSSANSKNVKWEGQCIWRFHPKKKLFEIYAEGGGNTFSLDMDSKGRVFSGTNNGCFVGHVSPEAAEGGPLAAVRDGDTITIDVPQRQLQLHVADDEIRNRLAQWQRPPLRHPPASRWETFPRQGAKW